MVNTFTCDSCGRNNVPDAEKKQILMKFSGPTGQMNSKSKPEQQTITEGMDVCPDCVDNGLKRNHIRVSKEGDTERFFAWNPSPDKHSSYVWGQQDKKKAQEQTAK